ncbi:MAG: histone deacetylase [Bacteroidota bacterium]
MFKIGWSPIYVHPLPDKHRFPMEKYELLRQQLLYEGTVTEDNFFEPGMVADEDVLRVHQKEYFQKLNALTLTPKEIRKTGFPLSEQLIHREKVIMQGTLECTRYALEHGVSMNIAGGTHHAYSEHGEGFCLLNDIAIASGHLLESKLARKILVVDLDVHQGNGTAEIFADNDSVFTFSMHGEKNYPMKKEKSDLDIALRDDTGDQEYLSALDDHLSKLLKMIKPDFIFFQSGVDILATDKLGRLSLSLDGCKQRDEIVLSACKQKGIPLVASMGGGYSKDVRIIVEAHANTFRLAQNIYF